MRRSLAVVLVTLMAPVSLSCTAEVGGCEIDPTVPCYEGNATGAGSSGSGGTGAPDCVDPKMDCTGALLECQQWACQNGKCTSVDAVAGEKCGQDGALLCIAGVCSNCTNVAQCADQECHTKACTDGKCVYTAEALLPCGPGGLGSCGAVGECGLCDDAVQNGAETGPDCGVATQCGGCPGEACEDDSGCKSESCFYGVCCDVACDGKCQACVATLTDLPDGTCGAVELGKDDPVDPECSTKGGCGAVEGWCACGDGLVTLFNDPNKDNETDVDCGGECGDTCTIGQKCGGDGDCAAGLHCADGFCCNLECAGECASCGLDGLKGICSSFAGPDTGICDAPEQCAPLGACLKATDESCSNSQQCATSLCKGPAAIEKKCVECDNVGNVCENNLVCADGNCVFDAQTSGSDCSVNAACSSGFCVDGVCCDNECIGPCMSCREEYTGMPGTNGQCHPIAQGRDPHGGCTGPGAAATCNGLGACGQNN